MRVTRRNGWVLAWIPVILYASIMFYLSSLSHLPRFLPTFFLADKLLHGGEYAAFSLLIFRAFELSPHRSQRLRSRILLTILIVTLYGISDEFHQSFVPYRDPSVFDLMADIVGGSLGIYIGHWLLRREVLL